jgi:nucleoside-diphosphate-sugar epimerase
MHKRIFLAGAAGAVGRPLCLLLVRDGWQVTGMTRSAEKAALLRDMSVEPAVVDVYDEANLSRAVAAAAPEIVIHQLTDLPPGLDPPKMAAGVIRNARIREVGTRHLLAAAVHAGAKRIVAQSIGFAYAPGPMPYGEDSPLDPGARGVISLERQVLEAPLESVILRYGRFYGPGTGFEDERESGKLHVDAAADAARRAVTRGRGIYNIAEEDGEISSRRAAAELGWSAAFRIG